MDVNDSSAASKFKTLVVNNDKFELVVFNELCEAFAVKLSVIARLSFYKFLIL